MQMVCAKFLSFEEGLMSGLASLAHWAMGREIVVLFFEEPPVDILNYNSSCFCLG